MRSKVLLISNIISTVYVVALVLIFGGAIIKAGGVDYVRDFVAYLDVAFKFFGTNNPDINYLYVLCVIICLLCIHIIICFIGCLFGWIAFAAKKSGIAKFSAVLYLIATICFPIFIIFGLPITIIGFIAGGNQKKLIKNMTHTEKRQNFVAIEKNS